MTTVRQGCKTVQFSIPADLLRRIDLDTFDKQQHRAHWLIEAAEAYLGPVKRSVAGNRPEGFSKPLYDALIDHAARTSSGIPRVQLEAIVASVIVKLHEAPDA